MVLASYPRNRATTIATKVSMVIGRHHALMPVPPTSAWTMPAAALKMSDSAMSCCTWNAAASFSCCALSGRKTLTSRCARPESAATPWPIPPVRIALILCNSPAGGLVRGGHLVQGVYRLTVGRPRQRGPFLRDQLHGVREIAGQHVLCGAAPLDQIHGRLVLRRVGEVAVILLAAQVFPRGQDDLIGA